MFIFLVIVGTGTLLVAGVLAKMALESDAGLNWILAVVFAIVGMIFWGAVVFAAMDKEMKRCTPERAEQVWELEKAEAAADSLENLLESEWY